MPFLSHLPDPREEEAKSNNAYLVMNQLKLQKAMRLETLSGLNHPSVELKQPHIKT